MANRFEPQPQSSDRALLDMQALRRSVKVPLELFTTHPVAVNGARRDNGFCPVDATPSVAQRNLAK